MRNGFGLIVGVLLVLSSASRAQSRSDLEALGNIHAHFLVTEDLVKRFDAAIAKGGTVLELIQRNPGDENLYAKLIASRVHAEELQDLFKQRLLFLQAVESQSPAGPSSVLGYLKGRIEELKKKSGSESESVEFALSDLKEFARSLDSSSGLQNESMDHSSDPARIKQWRRANAGRSFRSSKLLSVRNAFRWLEKSAPPVQEALVHGLELEFENPNADLKIFPSAGSSGNISGNGFPTGTWALTFDDGPGATTDQVLSNLRENNIKASFFVLSGQLDKSGLFRSYAMKEISDGHDVLSHSYNHLQISKLGPDDRKHEIEGAVKDFESVIGKRPDFFRLPYGAGVSMKSVRTDILKSCMVHVFWNVDTLDWHDHDPDTIYARAVSQMKTLGRGVILFHDIHSQSVAASARVMKYLNEEKLRTVRISEITDEINAGKHWACKLGW